MQSQLPIRSWTVKIYTLSDASGNIFYVGKTTLRPCQRLAAHLNEARTERKHTNSIKNDKIRGLNYNVIITVVETIKTIGVSPSNAYPSTFYRELVWMKHFKDKGYGLTNREMFTKSDRLSRIKL